MAFGKSQRMDSRRSSSSYCSTVTLVVFVALCLVGVWMMTSSSVVPVQNVDVPSQETKSEIKEQVTENDARQFEDSSGDVPEDVMKGDTNTNMAQEETISEVNQNQNIPEKTNPIEETREENSVKESEDTKNGSDDKSENQTGNDGDEKTDGGETNMGGGEVNSDGGEKNMGGGEVNSDGGETNTEGGEANANKQSDSQEKVSESEKKSDSGESSGETTQDEKSEGQIEEKVEQNQGNESEQSSVEGKAGDQSKDQVSSEVFPDGAQSEILNETNTQNGAFSTQAVESKNEKEAQESSKGQNVNEQSVAKDGNNYGYSWKLCNVTAGPDYIPCLDNEEAIRKLPSTKHYEHRERHCPKEGPTCLVPLPEGYKQSTKWPISRDKIWYFNVPHTKLAVVKGHQNWVKVTGEYLTFPGGGTQFKHGALHYIDFIQEVQPDIAWGKQSRVVLDVGCGVASFGGYLFDRDVLTMSFAPKDEHEAQVQFALERGIPAISAVMGTKRLPFPGKVFDVVHCARCRVPWHIEGGKLLLELNRVLRPGGYFVWSATPVYQKLDEDVEIWNAMSKLTKSMCWEMVTVKRDRVNEVGAAIFKKPSSNDCYQKRSENDPPLCSETDDPNAAWNIPLQACMHRIPEGVGERGSKWPEQWPLRMDKTPYWLNDSQVGVYGKPAPEDFLSDYEHWKHVVSKSYLNGLGISWSNVRNVMDMRSVYGGFAAALRDLSVWVMNVVSIDAPDTLPIIFERGLFGMYHDWCESFSSYPRTYDLLHADHLFSKLKKRCKLVSVVAEVDRLLRPEGKLIVRDNVETINEVENMARSMQWEIRLTYSKDKEGLLCVQKGLWRPKETAGSSTA
ncbi:S-adenosyl-L-methionine-dependent methyltransferases superfamily protein [Tasmannia lanceolata]|uniref:S-adenosyl-L-methionine-dependent methyltransferases superfamily protein n=1 Tax=Tasmannia lanceolata TaxID=3420 RepID=UPI00406421F7